MIDLLRNIRSILFVLAFGGGLTVGMANTNASFIFDGTTYASPGEVSFNNNVTTVELWAFHTEWESIDNEVIMSFYESGGWEFRINNGFVFLNIVLDGSAKSISFPLTGLINGWHHFSFSFDGNYVRFYVDGYQRGFLFDFRSKITAPSANTWLCIAADAVVNGAGSARFKGQIDEVRIWDKALLVSDIRNWMHSRIDSVNKPAYVDHLILYYAIDSAALYLDKSAIINDKEGYDLIEIHQPRDTISTAPISDELNGYSNVRAIWNTIVQGTYSEPSGGMNLGIKNFDELECFENAVFGHNNVSGCISERTSDGVDLQAKRVWYLDRAFDDELPCFRFQLFDAGAGGLYYDCLPVDNYKLMYAPTLLDSFIVVDAADDMDGNLIFFRDINAKSGYYSIARDNDMPSVYSAMEITNITSSGAVFGGVVGCDGGTPVEAYGVCWNTEGAPSVYDSLTIDGAGTGDFVSVMSGLEAGVVYHVRAYATNAEGTSYGEEIAFQTNKIYQKVTFPNIPAKTYGCGDFEPGAFSSSGLPISYTTSKEEVATIVDGQIHVTGVGTTNIWAYQPGNHSYTPSTYKQVTLTVKKAEANIIANDNSRYYGDTCMILSYIIEGLVYGEDKSVIDVLPILHCDLEDSSSVGMYDILAEGAMDDHYYFTYQKGTYAVLKSDPNINSWPSISPLLAGNSLSELDLIGGEGYTEGYFEFANPEYVPCFDGELVDVAFVPIDTINYSCIIEKVGVMMEVATFDAQLSPNTLMYVYPNPARNYLKLEGAESLDACVIYNDHGKKVLMLSFIDNCIDVSLLEPGLYVLKTKNNRFPFIKQ